MRVLTVLFCLAFCNCMSSGAPPNVGYLPDGIFANTITGEDPQTAALGAAYDAFSHPSQMHGQPAETAIAIAALDATAGQFSASGRWAGADDLTKQELLLARSTVRAVLGIPDDASSQTVIDSLTAAARAIQADDTAAAMAALSGPDFTKPPAASFALLNAFPYVASADRALLDAQTALYPQGGGGNDNNE